MPPYRRDDAGCILAEIVRVEGAPPDVPHWHIARPVGMQEPYTQAFTPRAAWLDLERKLGPLAPADETTAGYLAE